jgi:ribosomal protein S18 acetylase RimI-like enzyme
MSADTAVQKFQPHHQPAVRRMLEQIGWAEQYVAGAEQAITRFARDPEGTAQVALIGETVVGFVFAQYAAWNQLVQIHGLAVAPAHQRRGIATALVQAVEGFAKGKNARGVYVDTPVSNTGGRRFYEALGYALGYVMPRYYEDQLDGVTYQKFFK